MKANYEWMWKQLKVVIKSGDIGTDGDITESDLLRVMEDMELDED